MTDKSIISVKSRWVFQTTAIFHLPSSRNSLSNILDYVFAFIHPVLLLPFFQFITMHLLMPFMKLLNYVFELRLVPVAHINRHWDIPVLPHISHLQPILEEPHIARNTVPFETSYALLAKFFEGIE